MKRYIPNQRTCIDTRRDNFHFSVTLDPHTNHLSRQIRHVLVHEIEPNPKAYNCKRKHSKEDQNWTKR